MRRRGRRRKHPRHHKRRTSIAKEGFIPSQAKLRELFILWLSLPSTQVQIEDYFETKSSSASAPANPAGDQARKKPALRLRMSHLTAIIARGAGVTSSGQSSPLTPLPQDSVQRPVSRRHRRPPPPIALPRAFPADFDETPFLQSIPRFYFPLGHLPKPSPSTAGILSDLEALDYPMPQERFRTEVLGGKILDLPVYITLVLWRHFKAAGCTPEAGVTRDVLVKWVEEHYVNRSRYCRFFNCFCLNGRAKNEGDESYVDYADFRPLMTDMVTNHPGLNFLESTPAFQEKYAETVIIRIFYNCVPSGDSRMTLRQFTSSKFVDAFVGVCASKDVNKELEFFSYEHFYVLYCKFWELDKNHDFLVSKDDLQKYSNYSLTERIIDRIFGGFGRTLCAKKSGFLSFEDFVWFCMSEEDKTSRAALGYWFRCVDTDANGFIAPHEMEYFFEEQVQRMKMLTNEEIRFRDVRTQILDMIQPEDPNRIYIHEIERAQMSRIFFDILFNLNKFLMFEQRGFAILRNRQHLSPWAFFARVTYDCMSAEEDEEEGEAAGEGGAEDDAYDGRDEDSEEMESS